MIRLSDAATLFHADCRDALRTLPSDSLDSCVTDPPYALVSTLKRFANSPRSEAAMPTAGPYARASAGFMGCKWDTGETAFSMEFWSEVLRVLKPGGFVAAFGASRGYHRMACAIEDAGFEIRDSLMWIYGTGFPKSHNVEHTLGAEWEGWGTALKPAFEPIVLARKPLSEGTVAANVLRWRTGALNIDGCRVSSSAADQAYMMARVGGFNNTRSIGGDGILGGGETIDRTTFDPTKGRWPANVVTDGSDEVVSAFPTAGGQLVDASTNPERRKTQNVYGAMKAGNGRDGEASVERRYTDEGGTNFAMKPGARRNDSGSAARFFYSAKASKADRAGSKHPTVKPISLMEWLTTLVTPPGGTVLDPFAGSGTTGIAATRKGFKAVLCEREDEYVADIRARFGTPRGGRLAVPLDAIRAEAALRPALEALRARLSGRVAARG